MKRIVLKDMRPAEVEALYRLAVHFVEGAAPGPERLARPGALDGYSLHRQLVAILCTRLSVQLAKCFARPGWIKCRLSIPREHGAALLLAYWQLCEEVPEDLLLENRIQSIHQQLA